MNRIASAGFSSFVFILCIAATALPVSAPAQPQPLIIGLNASQSGGAGQSGIAIERGLRIAIDEINAAGGILGRPLRLEVRDSRSIPARARDATDEFAAMPGLIAMVSGSSTPVALSNLEKVHAHEIVYLVPWAAGTPVVANQYEPNFVFRVSVRDEYAGGFLIDAALERSFRKPALLLWRTGWGRSNERAMTDAMRERGIEAAATEWFNTGEQDLSGQIDRIVASGADVIMLVSTANAGVLVARELASRPPEERLPIISHWGITTGDFFNRARDDLAQLDVTFLQTFSFFDPPFPAKAQRVSRAYCTLFDACQLPAGIVSPVGTAHAYDLVHLLAKAVEQAGSADRRKIRAALERLGRHEGLVRVYDPPFSPVRHDALDRADFRLSRYDETGAIVPVEEQ